MIHFMWNDYQLCENSYSIYEFANAEIPKWAEYHLSKITTFHQSIWEAGRVTDNPEDILLGHCTYFPQNEKHIATKGRFVRNWVKDNALTSDQFSHPNTYILMPWVPEFPIEWTVNMQTLDYQLSHARLIFSMCGEIWFDKTLEKRDDSIQSKVKDKLIRVNMGVAAQNLTVSKQSFNEIGERSILHISNLQTYKGFETTCRSLMGLNTSLYVGGNIPRAQEGLMEINLGVDNFIFNYIGSVENHDWVTNAWIVDTCDFYIHTATMDAQATTVLENCARGLIPLITPESGFLSPHAIYLTHDPDENRKIIDWALNLPEQDLLNRSYLLREQIVKEHNWESIFTKIWDVISQDLEQRKFDNAD